MKIQSAIQAHTAQPATSFFAYTRNNSGGFQRFKAPDRFDAQMHAGSSAGLLLYEHPAHLVASTLMQEQYDGSRLRQWIDEAQLHLDIVRRHRRRMIVLERDATTDPSATATFAEAFTNTKPPAEFTPKPEQPPSLFALIGLIAIRQHSEAARLLSELEASSIVMNAHESSFDDTLATIVKDLRAYSPDEAEQEIQSLKANCESLTDELQRRNETGDKNDILIQQVLELQTSLGETETKRISGEADLRRKVAALSDENEKLKASIELIRNSTSWRLTKPVRAVKGVFSR